MFKRVGLSLAVVLALGFCASAQAKDQAKDVCSLRGTAGTYIVRCTGFAVPSPGVNLPAVILLVEHRGRDGEMSGSGTISLAGTIVPTTFTGTNEVKPDCTGTEELSQSIGGGPPAPAHFNFVVGTDSNEIYGINTDAPNVLMCTDTRVSNY
jgi:hypothetical protein